MTSNEFIPFALPYITDAEIQAVTEVLRSGWVTTGPRTKEFETRFGEAVGASHCVAVNSCTAALHLALEAVGVRAGDEVVLPTLTFAATAGVVRHLGARPVLVDVRASDHNVDPAAMERAITSRTKAIVPVHFAGVPADMDEIRAMGRARGIPVVADSAHAFPASYKGRNVGTLADLTCFSFYAIKTMTTGEGGAIVTENPEWADRMRIMSLHGISRDAWKRYTSEGSWYYEVLAPGFKYNLTDTAAAMGLVQLARSPEMLARREAIAARYDEALRGEPGLEFLSHAPDRTHARHLYIIKLVTQALRIDRNTFMEELRRRGVGASVHFIPLHVHPYYRETYGYVPESLPVAWDVYQRSVSIPFFAKMTDDQVSRVIDTVKAILRDHRR